MNLNVSPYFDDFAEEKNFLRVLFNPSKAVQARELTQIQSVLQNQVSKFANHMFKDNTPILEGQIKISFEKNFFKLSAVDPYNPLVAVDGLAFLNKTITGATSNAVATVTHVDITQNADPLLNDIFVYFEYAGGTFLDSEIISAGFPVDATIVPGSAGKAIVAHCDAGIIYTAGHFVVVESQELIVTRDSTARMHIGFERLETIVQSGDDSSLFDPAQGSYNYNAPGADRLKYELVIKSYTDATIGSASTSFFSQVITDGGIIVQDTGRTQYAEIMDMIARRTHDTSGDYAVEDFPILIEDDVLPENVAVTLEAGKAYVLGYEHETISATPLTVERARTVTATKTHILTNDNINRYVNFGPFVDIAQVGGVDDINGLLSVNERESITLHSQADGAGPALTDSSGNPHTFKIAAITRNTVGEMRVFLADAQDKTDLIVSARSIKGTNGNWANIETYANGLPVVGGKDSGIPIIELEGSDVAVKNIVPNSADVVSIKSLRNQAVTGGSITITMLDNDTDFVTFTAGGLVSCVDSSGLPSAHPPINLVAADYVVTNNIGTPSTLTINNLGAATFIDITYKTNRQATTAQPGTKTITTVNAEAIPATNTNTFATLAQEDIIRLISVIENPAGAATDVTNSVVLDNGARDFYYDNGQVFGIRANTEYAVTYEYYAHSTSAAKEIYFTAESYTGTNAYETIPEYTTKDGLTTYDLRNCVDFRRKLSDINGGIGVDAPHPSDSIFSCGYEYYVGRIDKIYIDDKGEFGIKSGIPARAPEEPQSIDDTMTLYTLTIPAYTFDTNDIGINPVDNRRYTMRDIGELEQRIESLETYTSLNLLETSASDVDVLDANGLNKFKNGIFVDDFKNFSGSNEAHAMYRGTIDEEEGTFRSVFDIKNVELNHNMTTAQILANNIQIHDSTATLKYSTDVLVNQNKASAAINVNPYAVFSWTGEVSLTPAIDHWVDNIRLPTIQRTSGKPVRRKIFHQWGSWRMSWTGSSVSTKRSRRGPFWRRRTLNTTTTVRTGTLSRSGLRTVVTPTLRRVWQDKIVSREQIPYMRARWIQFTAQGMRPGITLTATFDDKTVTQFCKANVPFGDGTTGVLKTNSAGECVGYFRLPGGQFTTGTKEFKLFDTVQGEEVSAATANYTAAGVRLHRQGTITSIHGSRVTRTPLHQGVGVRTVSTSSTWARRSRRRRRWSDPIAQTFLIETKSEQGVFLDSIDLFFQTKDTILPVSVHIVETENGMPTQNIVPFSRVELKPIDVNVSNNSAMATNFKFSDPVYLQDGTEYAFVIMTNSTKYKVYHATLGGVDLLDGKGIFKQPYAGVMFTSQNASTWTPDQNSDVKFKLTKCVFPTGITGTYTMDTKLSTITISAATGEFSPQETVTASSGGTGKIEDSTATTLTLSNVSGAFSDTDTITGTSSGTTATQSGAIVAVDDITYATNAHFNIDTLELNGTFVELGHKFPGRASFTIFDAENDVELPSRFTIDADTNPLECEINISTSNANISPVISLERTSAICVDTDDAKIITYTGAVGEFVVGEIVSGSNLISGVAPSGTVLSNDGAVLQLGTHNRTLFTNGQTLTGSTSGATATQSVDEISNMGTYVTNTVTLEQPADEIRVIVDAYIPNGADMNVSFASTSLIAKYSTISGIAAYTDNSTAYYGLEQSVVSKDSLIYDITTPSAPVYKGSCVVTKVANGRVYMQSISDPTVFTGAVATNEYAIATESPVAGTNGVVAWGAANVYVPGEWVIHKDLLWKCNIDTVALARNSAEPTPNGSDWTQIDGVLSTNSLNEDAAQAWRPMKLKTVPANTHDTVIEYQFIPDEVINDEFQKFAVRLELTGVNPADVPQVANFRAIAVS